MNTVKVKCNECGVEFDKNIYECNRKKKLGKNKNGTRHWRKERYLPVSSKDKTPSS